jgi:hypothetical protein
MHKNQWIEFTLWIFELLLSLESSGFSLVLQSLESKMSFAARISSAKISVPARSHVIGKDVKDQSTGQDDVDPDVLLSTTNLVEFCS